MIQSSHTRGTRCARPVQSCAKPPFAGAGWVAAILVVACMSAALATELPPGFQESIVVETPFPANFSQFAFASDGRLFMADKFGLVTVYAPDPGGDYIALSSRQFTVATESERGINGLALDPDFATNRHVWMYYSTPPPHRNRLSRFTYVNGVWTDETVMIEGPLVQNLDSNAGCIRFASDKTLFVAMGDDLQGSVTAQDPFDLRGKILHINRDGSPAANNPYLDGSAGDPRVWAIGFRNPYRISIQPESDNVFIADVGHLTSEELNLGIAGSDFGWAEVEGHTPPASPGKTYPIHRVDHEGAGAAIIGGDHAPTGFAPDYAGDYFYADFVEKTLWRVELDKTNTPLSVELFASDFGHATDIQFGPGDALYYVCRSCAPASLRKIEYVDGPNNLPIARASALPDSGPAPLQVHLDGSASSDADDDPLIYDWDLGDSGQSTMESPTHVYGAGVYEATLTVDDGQGGEDSTTPVRIVAGNARPVAELLTPVDEDTYDAGQLVLYSGSVVDPEDGQVPCTSVTWQIFRHHPTHTHPFRGPIQGSCVGAFAIPLDGDASADQWYEIRLTGEDSGAPLGPNASLTGSASLEIRPNVAAMTFDSTPIPGLTVKLDEAPFQTPQTVLGLVNAPRTIGTLDLQMGPDGQWYRFTGWSDGGAIDHTIDTPAIDTIYTAEFECAAPEVHNLMINPGVADAIDLTWDEPIAGCLQSGPGRYRIYSATFVEPSAGGADFPSDPMYWLIGTSGTPQFSYPHTPRDVYYLVVATDPNDVNGVVGHYGM